MKPRKKRPAARRSAPRRRRSPAPLAFEERETEATPPDRASHHETSPVLTGGDVDADWLSAHSVGEEAVGGSVATPDQDIVDALGAALGVPQAPDEPVRTSEEILAERDAHRWQIEREIAQGGDRRPPADAPPRRRGRRSP